MRIFNERINKWMNCPQNKFVVNKGSWEPKFTREGLERYADIKGLSVDVLIDRLHIGEYDGTYRVEHGYIQCDKDFIYLIENNKHEIIFETWPNSYKPEIVSLDTKEDLIIVYETQFYDAGVCDEETIYKYKDYKECKDLWNKYVTLKQSLKRIN